MLILRALWPYALCLLIGAFAAYKVQEWRWEADVNTINAIHDAATLKAERDARKIEQNMQVAIETIQAKSNEQEKQLQADIAAANASADSLRQRLAERTKRAIADTGPAASGETARSTLILYSQLLDRAEERDAEVSGYADAARAAGLNCEALYESARQLIRGKE